MGPVYVWGAVGDGFILCVKCANRRDPEWQRVGSGLAPLIYPNESEPDPDDPEAFCCDDCGTMDFEH